MMHIHAAFQIFKELLNNGETHSLQTTEDIIKTDNDNNPSASDESTNTNHIKNKVSDLQYQLQQRDNEIQILVAFIRKREAVAWDTTRPLSAQPFRGRPSSARLNSTTKEHEYETTTCQFFAEKDVQLQKPNTPELKKPMSMASNFAESITEITPDYTMMDKEKAFELFIKGNDKMEAIEENKSLLKTIYADAKVLSEKVNRSRDSINVLKERIEKNRVERAHDYLLSGICDESALDHDEEEDDLLCCMDAEKRAYKEGFGHLRDAKKEIEHLNRIIEQNRSQLQAEFEVYWNAMGSSHAEVESSMKNLSISKMQIPIGSKKETKSLLQQECIQETFSNSLPNPNQELNLHQTHAAYSMSFPSPKHYDGTPKDKTTFDHFGERVAKNSNYLCHSKEKQQLIETINNSSLQSIDPIPLTGSAIADTDIIAFYKARDQVLKKVY